MNKNGFDALDLELTGHEAHNHILLIKSAYVQHSESEVPCIIVSVPDCRGWRLCFGSPWLAFIELGGVPGVRPTYRFIPPAERAKNTD